MREGQESMFSWQSQRAVWQEYRVRGVMRLSRGCALSQIILLAMLLRGGGMAMVDVYQENMQGCVQICSCFRGSNE